MFLFSHVLCVCVVFPGATQAALATGDAPSSAVAAAAAALLPPDLPSEPLTMPAK